MQRVQFRQSLWRNDDVGAHWAEVGSVPGNVEAGIQAVSHGNGAAPLLYLDSLIETCTTSPEAAVSGGPLASTLPNSGSCNASFAPGDLQASADGGKTWTAAPAKGFPAAQTDPGVPLGVLNDGPVICAVPGTESQGTKFMAWKAGDASWHQVGTTITQTVSTAFVAAGADGAQTLWVVTTDGQAYRVQSYQV